MVAKKKTQKKVTNTKRKPTYTDILSRSLNEIKPALHSLQKILKKDISLISLKNLMAHPAFGLAIVFIIWGASIPITKIALFEIGPASFLFLRMVVAALVLFPFALRYKTTFSMREEFSIFFSAIFGIGIHIYLIYLALPSVSSINVPVINALSPFILVLLAWIFFREKIKKQKYIGMAFGFIGAIMITMMPMFFGSTNVLGAYASFKFSPFIGDVLILVSAIFGSMAPLLVKSIRHIPGHIITFWQSAIIAVAVLPMAIAEVPSTFVPSMSIAVYIAIAFAGILNSVVAYSIYNDSLHKLPASDVGLLSYLSPIGTLALAIPLLHEMPDIWFVLGTILVLYGVWVAERKIIKAKV